MKSRPVAATFFVAFCLLLCGLILRRQIAAHPLPAAGRQQFSASAMGQGPHFSGDRPDFWMGLQDWNRATPAITGQAREAVQGQLTALHDGDGAKAVSFQSERMRRMFTDPNQFEQMISLQYPEFARCHHALYGPVWMDKGGQHVRADVIVVGENGHRARGEYLLVREGSLLRIASVQTHALPN